MQPLSHKKVMVISRCAWTLFNFRISLLQAIAAVPAQAIALGAGGDGYDGRLREQGVDFRAVPVAKRGMNPLADLHLLAALVGMMRRERPDVVHCFTIKPAIYGTVAAWICRVPVRVVTITGLGHIFTSAPGLTRRLVIGLYTLALRCADLVYFQNREDRDFFVHSGIVAAAKTQVCAGSGVDTRRFAPAGPPPSRPGPRFLMIARLIREKGIAEYLDAAATVKRQYPDVQFAVLGAADPRNPTALSARELETLRRSDVVTWLGETDDVRPHIAQADVLVLPSYREGLPRTLIEGGAMGRPAIATDVVGCRDVVVHGETGLLVPPMNAEALAAAMLDLIKDPRRRVAMGAAARRQVLARFDERSVIDMTLEDYRRLLRGRQTDADKTAAA
jgi:glycosyltransferase involved in cell wall biosynthesis